MQNVVLFLIQLMQKDQTFCGYIGVLHCEYEQGALP